jgi:hypothetical protein
METTMRTTKLENLHRKVEAVRTLNAANEPLRELLDEILAEHRTHYPIPNPGDRLCGAVFFEESTGPKLRECRSFDCDLTWRRDHAGWVLLYKRRRMGRVLPDNQHRGMYRSVLSRGHLSDMANLSWAKGAVLAAAIRELAWEADHPAIDPKKCPGKGGVFYGLSPAGCENGAG